MTKLIVDGIGQKRHPEIVVCLIINIFKENSKMSVFNVIFDILYDLSLKYKKLQVKIEFTNFFYSFTINSTQSKKQKGVYNTLFSPYIGHIASNKKRNSTSHFVSGEIKIINSPRMEIEPTSVLQIIYIDNLLNNSLKKLSTLSDLYKPGYHSLCNSLYDFL